MKQSQSLAIAIASLHFITLAMTNNIFPHLGCSLVGTPHLEEIQQAKTAKQAAMMGRNRKRPLRADWQEVKDDVMQKAILKKFVTHREIREILLATGDEEIIENAPGDYYWGCGKDGSGKNMLGKILMEVREKLRSER